MSVVCVRCKQPIRWATTIAGYPIALDADPHKRGNLRLKPASHNPHVEVAVPVPRADRSKHAGRLYLSHLCPWGKRKR